METGNKLIVVQEKQIRRTEINGDWWYVLVDVIEVLTDSTDPRQYFEKLRKRDPELDGFVRTNCTGVAFKGETGKTRTYLSASTEGVFRIIMSVPLPKAEPFKRWFAQLGKERVDEIENPELAAARARELYRAKGYPEDWIEMRFKEQFGFFGFREHRMKERVDGVFVERTFERRVCQNQSAALVEVFEVAAERVHVAELAR